MVLLLATDRMSKRTTTASICCYLAHVVDVMVVQMAQAVLVPLLVDKEKVGPSALSAIKSMMVMQPPPSFKVRPQTVQVLSFNFLDIRLYTPTRLDHMLHCAW